MCSEFRGLSLTFQFYHLFWALLSNRQKRMRMSSSIQRKPWGSWAFNGERLLCTVRAKIQWIQVLCVISVVGKKIYSIYIIYIYNSIYFWKYYVYIIFYIWLWFYTRDITIYYIHQVCAVYVIKICTCTMHGSYGMVSSQRSDYPDSNDSTIGLYLSTHRLTRIVWAYLWNCKSHVTNAKWAFFPFSFIEEFAGYEMTFATSATRSFAIKGGPIQHEVTRVGDKYG